MQKQILSGLRTTFLVHFIVGAIIGLAYLLVPEWFAGLFGFQLKEVFPWQMVGAAVCAFAASSWWAWHETDWAAVKIIVEMELIWTVLGTIVGAWAVLFLGYPPILWINPIILLLFAIAFGYFYLQQSAMTTQAVRR